MSTLNKRLSQLLHKQSRRMIGLMSGMSMDGVDLACIEIGGEFPNLVIKRIGTHFKAYSSDFKTRLRSGQSASVDEVSALNVLVAEEFSSCVNEFLKIKNLASQSIDAIGSHGQTLFHSTEKKNEIQSTLQVGSPSIIAEKTGIVTVGNFRVRDVASGGRGAPLVPVADYLLFRDPDAPIVLNNLGSISNLTVVTPNLADMLAFDTGPANMAIDFFSRWALKNEDAIDEDGKISAGGKCIPDLLASLLNNEFFKQAPPKAAGYQEFGPKTLLNLVQPYLKSIPADLIRTAVEFSAVTLSQAYIDFVLPRYPRLKKAIFSGGGTHNLTLMKRIRELLDTIQIEILDKEASDSKEAVCFAILANETLSGRPGSLPSTTGALKPTVLGEIAL